MAVSDSNERDAVGSNNTWAFDKSEAISSSNLHDSNDPCLKVLPDTVQSLRSVIRAMDPYVETWASSCIGTSAKGVSSSAADTFSRLEGVRCQYFACVW